MEARMGRLPENRRYEMIKEITVYTVICDRCGADSNKDSEHVGWTTIDAALDLAGESGWWFEDEKHLCANCWESIEGYDPDEINNEPFIEVTL
jgi:hypothetical protein